MSEKKVPNNIKGRREGSGAALVDPQLLRWRKAIAKRGIVLGTATKAAKKRNEKLRAERAEPEPTKKKWF
jgi:hypothetical protein